MMRLIVFCATLTVALGAFSGDPRTAKILRSEQDISPEGVFSYAFDTENGISAQEQGTLRQVGSEAALVAQGGFGWQSPEGEQVQIQYVADENGYQPSGSALPTPPPIPETILRALEYIRAHPQPAPVGRAL